jgi:biotin operon repressor
MHRMRTGGGWDSSLPAEDHLFSLRDKWWFVMVHPEALLTVLDGIAEGPRTKLTARVLARCLRNMDSKTGRVLLTRQQLATDLETTETAVSLALATLRDCGAIVSEHDRRQQVRMTIKINSNFATHLGEGPREVAQAGDPPVRRRRREPAQAAA